MKSGWEWLPNVAVYRRHPSRGRSPDEVDSTIHANSQVQKTTIRFKVKTFYTTVLKRQARTCCSAPYRKRSTGKSGFWEWVYRRHHFTCKAQPDDCIVVTSWTQWPWVPSTRRKRPSENNFDGNLINERIRGTKKKDVKKFNTRELQVKININKNVPTLLSQSETCNIIKIYDSLELAQPSRLKW